jgi:GTP-binding protein
VIADIPGIIEGAHEGIGLGHEFLRHVERTRILLHFVDVSGCEGRDPVEDVHIINDELVKYSEKLAEKPQVIIANKMDIPSFAENFEKFKQQMEDEGYTVMAISAAAHKGIQEVINYTTRMLSELPEEEDEDYDYLDLDEVRKADNIEITVDDGVYIVEGMYVRKIVGSTNFDDYESLQYFQRALRKSGIIEMLEEKGIKEGDTVHMYGVEFDYIK